MRTTVDIDEPILKDLKRLQKTEGKSLGRLVSDLLAHSLADRKNAKGKASAFHWTCRPLGARVDISDSEAVLLAIDRADRKPPAGRARR